MKPNNLEVLPFFRPTRLTFTKERITSKKPEGNRGSTWGIVHLLLYYQILKDIEDGNLFPDQEVLFSAEAAKEYGTLRSTNGLAGEVRLLKDVINQAVSLNAPDCIVALFELYGGWEQTKNKLRGLSNLLNVSVYSRIAPTGRKKDIQLTNIYDYYKIGRAFLSLSKSSHYYLKNRSHLIHGKLFEPQVNLTYDATILSSIFWGTNQSECLIFKEEKGKLECFLVINGKNEKAVVDIASNNDFYLDENEYTSFLDVGKDIKYKDWLVKNFDGYFLNKKIIEDLEVDHVTLDESYMRAGKWNKVAFIALSAPNYRSLIPSTRQNIHKNEILKKSQLLDNVSLIVTDRPINELKDRIPQFIVPDSLFFAYQYASYMSEIYNGKFIAITGSVGKSSTRLMLRHLLQETDKIHENYRYTNLHYPTFGLGLEINNNYDISIFECAGAAMNVISYGNNSYLWRANVAIITAIGSAHALTGIERNMFIKKQIFYGVKEGGYAVINGDIEKKYLTPILNTAKELNLNILQYSMERKDVDCRLLRRDVQKDNTIVEVSLLGKELKFSLKTDSDGQIQNAMATLLAIECIGYSAENFVERFADYRSFERILAPVEIEINNMKVTLIDDTHNSSIEATMNGIDYFSSKKKFYDGEAILVLGEVADLGNQTNEQHKRLEPYINAASADKVFCLGEPFKHLEFQDENVMHCETREQIVSEIKKSLKDDSFVYIKGSLNSGVEFYKVVDMLKKEANVLQKGV
ncbi:Mur ligase family protein [Enterococcus hulanensis]|uniref:Mur ligase family protein n=1 Tax=Enterococcus hulanensis TaxID=2559929 RepID=UPI0028900ECE|nr:Mur ligase family protein [Enterococcus hulanensis]MDT2661978.1 Mur ligase family protein [Enterococcus hulanensis]